PVFAATRGSAVKLQSAVRSAGIIAIPAPVAANNPKPRASSAGRRLEGSTGSDAKGLGDRAERRGPRRSGALARPFGSLLLSPYPSAPAEPTAPAGITSKRKLSPCC